MNSSWWLFLSLGIGLLGQSPATEPRRDSSALQALTDQTHQLAEPRHYDGPPLTLSAALAQATSQNLEIVAQQRHADVTRSRPAYARSLAPPMFETEIWQWPINSLNPANTNMYMFMATQELPGRGKRDLRAAAAGKDIALAESDIASATREVIAAVKQSYSSLFLARKAIDIHLASAGVLRQFADVAQVKYATGGMSQQDVLKAVVELSKLHDDILTFDQQAQVGSAQLNALMNRPLDAPIGPLTDPEEQILSASSERLEEMALAHRPEVLAARQDIERAEAELAAAKQDVKPDFSIQGGYMLQPHQTDGWLARVGITWPAAPWARGKLDARIKEMTQMVEAATAREQAIETATRLALRQAYLGVKTAEQRAALLRTTIVPQSQQTLEVSRVAYQTDRADFLAMLDNERVLLDAQLEYYRAISAFDHALAALERAVGTDLTPDMLGPVGRSAGRRP